MPYLGNDPGAITDAFTDTFSGNGSNTGFTLTRASTTNSVFVRIHGVMQRNGTDFTVDGTTLTFTTAPPNASNNIVVQFFTVGSVQEVADNAITLAKMAHGTDGNLITYDAAGAPAAVATGSSGQVLTSAGAGSPPTFATLNSMTLGTPVASTSGTTIDFTGIPSGVKRITINFQGISTDGSNIIIVQLGDAGGFETSGYVAAGISVASIAARTDSFPLSQNSATGALYHGTLHCNLLSASAFTWIASGTFIRSDGPFEIHAAGSKSLSAELTQVRITSVSADDFDAGAVNISFES